MKKNKKYLKKFVCFSQGYPDEIWERISKICNELEDVLTDLADNIIPNDTYTKSDLAKLCDSLIKGQRQHNLKRLFKNILKGKIVEYPFVNVSGTWALSPDGYLGNDDRYNFVYLPTFLSISILTFVMYRFPDIVNDIKNYKSKLRTAYFAVLRKLIIGSPYQYESETFHVIDILSKGNVIEHISKNPKYCKKFTFFLKNEKRIIQDMTSGGWNQDFFSEVRRCQKILKDF